MQSFIKNRDGINLFLKVDPVEEPRGIAVIVHGLCEHSGLL